MPPDAYKVPYLVDELLDWLNNSTDEMYPAIIAGILHYELVRIHPFVDGKWTYKQTYGNIDSINSQIQY